MRVLNKRNKYLCTVSKQKRFCLNEKLAMEFLSNVEETLSKQTNKKIFLSFKIQTD